MPRTSRHDDEDLEIRELIGRATEGLASTSRSVPSSVTSRHRAPIVNRPERKRYVEPVREPLRDPVPSLNVAAIIPFVLVVLLIVVPRTLEARTGHWELPNTLQPAVRSDAAFVTDAARFVHGVAGRSGDGRFLVTAVPRPARGTVRFSEEILAMRAARKNAIAAASGCLRSRVDISDVSINAEGFTGGSGGLMFALAVMDASSTDELTRGRNIAGTGTIAPDGTVGPVLYVDLKAVAAERAGADLFLVPAAQIAEARRGAAGALRVAPVRTLDGAVRLLTGGRGCATM